MDKFNKKLLKRMVPANSFHYTPFPGRYPVRLFIEVCVISYAGSRKCRRFLYNGKWKESALKAAHRVYNALEIGSRSSTVFEYCKSGILYNGSLEMGRINRVRCAVFPGSQTGGSIHCPSGSLVPFAISGGRYVMVDEKVLEGVDDLPQLRRLYDNNFRQQVGGATRVRV